MTRWYAVFNERRTEDRRQRPSDGIAEGEADGSGTRVGDPVALGDQSPAGDAVGEFFEVGIGGERFRRCSLMKLSAFAYRRYCSIPTYLVVVACLEEGRDADETDLIVPHHGEMAVGGIIGHAEDVLEDCNVLEDALASQPRYWHPTDLPSKALRPVWAKKPFFSL